MPVDGKDLCFKSDRLAIIIFVEVFSRDRIELDLLKYCDDVKTLLDNSIFRDFGFCTFYHPFQEFFSLYKRSLGKGSDGFAALSEILRLGLSFDNKADCVFITELSRDRQVACDFFSTVVPSFTGIPSLEVFSFYCRFSREIEGVTGIVFFCQIGFTFYDPCHCKSILLIISPDSGITADGYCVAEISAGIYPLCGITGLLGN